MRLGFEQCQPLGNGPEREGCDTWRLLLQMVQGLLEGKDGELPFHCNIAVFCHLRLDDPWDLLAHKKCLN